MYPTVKPLFNSLGNVGIERFCILKEDEFVTAELTLADPPLGKLLLTTSFIVVSYSPVAISLSLNNSMLWKG